MTLALLAVLAAVAAAIAARVWFARFSRQRSELQRLRTLFSRYVPEQVVDDLLARKDPRLFEARRYRATILSCRMRNFALAAEEFGAEETLRYLNEFYTVVGGAVLRNRGMIESLHGDCVTAVFGVLVEENFQEERALRAALDVVRLSDAMNERRKLQGRRALEVSVGVNSGEIVAGDTGFQTRREFAIVGHPAHVAASLQRVAEDLNASIVASQTTFDAVSDTFVGVPLSSLPLQGLRRLQHAHVIRGLVKQSTEDDLLALPSDELFKRTTVEEMPPTPGEYLDPAAPTARFSALDDDAPAMPGPPEITGTYEDDFDPPIALPP